MFLKVPETVCSLVEIPVPSQAKLHKQWCLFDQVLFYQAKNKLSQYLHLLSKRATSTLTERCGRSLDPWSRRSRTRTRSLTPFSRGTACLFFNFHFFTDSFIFDCCRRRGGRGRSPSFDEAAFISQLTLLDVQVHSIISTILVRQDNYIK